MKRLYLSLIATTLLQAAPAAPSNLHLTATTNSIKLTWSDNSNDERGFKIFRDSKFLTYLPADTTSYVDSSLKPNTKYKYEVRVSDDYHHNIINDIRLELSDNDIICIVDGKFSEGRHVGFFIDADGTPTSGYSRDEIKGADYLIEDTHLYRYVGPGWKWEKIDGNIIVDYKPKKITLRVSSGLEFDDYSINYGVTVASSDYKEITNYTYMNSIDMQDINNQNVGSEIKTISFHETPYTLRNPLKGYMIWENDKTSTHDYMSAYKTIIPWKEIERNSNDTADKISSYMKKNIYDKLDIEAENIKVNPLVILKKGRNDDFTPSDMDISDHDEQTQHYIDKIKEMVPKLAKAWDNDPHIGFVYMGIHGTWGEQFNPFMTPEVAKALGDSFTKYFKHKKVLVRIPNYFNETYLKSHNNKFWGVEYKNYYDFGMYWDAFAQDDEMRDGGLDFDGIITSSKFWKNNPLIGEVAFDMPYSKIYDKHDYPDDIKNSWNKYSPLAIHDTLTNEESWDYIRDYIRAMHATALSWISLYNKNDSAEARGAVELAKVLGYRFVLQKATFSRSIQKGENLRVAFDVINKGSAPFYYQWPVEVSLLDINTKQVVWHQHFSGVDIARWQPGDNWDFQQNKYKIPAKTYHIEESFKLPTSIEDGEYILALSINDPAGDKPSLRFAVTNYYKDGRTPLGVVGVGMEPRGELPAFDDIRDSSSIGYSAN